MRQEQLGRSHVPLERRQRRPWRGAKPKAYRAYVEASQTAAGDGGGVTAVRDFCRTALVLRIGACALAAVLPACFSQEATLGLPCTSARSCGRSQDCIDGVCQRTGDEPVYCPLRDDVVELGDALPALSTVLELTSALDLLDQCSSIGGDQAVYSWQPPRSGDFVARTRVSPAYFDHEDSLPPVVVRAGGCQGTQQPCDLGRLGAYGFSADRDEVVVVTLDDLPPVAANAVDFELIVEDALQCITGGELAATVPLQIEGTTAGSTDGVRPDRCVGPRESGFGPDVAFSWTAPRDGIFAINASSEMGDVLLYVLSHNCGGPQVACAHDLGATDVASTAVSLRNNETVVIVVDTPLNAEGTTFDLTIDEAFGCVPPGNDLGYQFPNGGIEVDATEARPTSLLTCTAPDAPQVVYRWTAPAAAFWAFDTRASDMPVVLSVLDGSCSGAALGCELGYAPLDEANDGLFALPLATGQDVVLTAAPQGTGILRIALEQAPCGSHLLASPLPIEVSGEVAPRSTPILECVGERPQPSDSTFSWRAPSNGSYDFSVTAELDQPLLYVLEDNCAGRALACSRYPADHLRLDLRAGDLVVIGLAAPASPQPLPFTLRIQAA